MRRLTLLVSMVAAFPLFAVLAVPSPAYADGEVCTLVPQACECRYVQVDVPPYHPWAFVCPPPLP
jgi:hypothetical protein